jgi:protein TonB
MTRITRRQITIAIVLAALTHAGVAAAVFWVPSSPGARAVGLGGIEVALGPTGGAPGDVSTPPPQDTPVVPPAEVQEKPKPEEVEVEQVQPIEPDSVVPVETERVGEVRPIPTPTPPRMPRPPEVERAETAKPPPEVVTHAALSVAGAGGKSGAHESPEAGSADAKTGGGMVGAATDYMSYLLAWLQKHKEYPREAQRRHQQGTALLYFEMDREGRVHSYQLRRSSGHESLDREVLALIHRAEPLPVPPPEVRGERIKLVVPVQFFLR